MVRARAAVAGRRSAPWRMSSIDQSGHPLLQAAVASRQDALAALSITSLGIHPCPAVGAVATRRQCRAISGGRLAQRTFVDVSTIAEALSPSFRCCGWFGLWPPKERWPTSSRSMPMCNACLPMACLGDGRPKFFQSINGLRRTWPHSQACADIEHGDRGGPALDGCAVGTPTPHAPMVSNAQESPSWR